MLAASVFHFGELTIGQVKDALRAAGVHVGLNPTEAGELMLFINESQIAFLEDIMWEQGYLEGSQMAGAFRMLRSNDLIWSRMVRTYLMGDREPMLWSATVTVRPEVALGDYAAHGATIEPALAPGAWAEASRAAPREPVRGPLPPRLCPLQ